MSLDIQGIVDIEKSLKNLLPHIISLEDKLSPMSKQALDNNTAQIYSDAFKNYYRFEDDKNKIKQAFMKAVQRCCYTRPPEIFFEYLNNHSELSLPVRDMIGEVAKSVYQTSRNALIFYANNHLANFNLSKKLEAISISNQNTSFL